MPVVSHDVVSEGFALRTIAAPLRSDADGVEVRGQLPVDVVLIKIRGVAVAFCGVDGGHVGDVVAHGIAGGDVVPIDVHHHVGGLDVVVVVAVVLRDVLKGVRR
jgi:hypothetical protein